MQSKKKLKVGCIYRSPNTDINIFNNELQTILESFKESKVYLCGKFNIDLLKYDCHQNSKDFVNDLFSLGFYPLINLQE